MSTTITIVGSRESPQWALQALQMAGDWCRTNKVFVRSGGAPGADLAAQRGALEYCLVYEPWKNFAPRFYAPGCSYNSQYVVPPFTPELDNLARRHHPTYDRLSDPVKKLMMRNGCQVLGLKLNNPSRGCLYYAPMQGGTEKGGTRQAASISREAKVPCLNLFYQYKNPEKAIQVALEFVEKMASSSSG